MNKTRHVIIARFLGHSAFVLSLASRAELGEVMLGLRRKYEGQRVQFELAEKFVKTSAKWRDMKKLLRDK